jgi:hypothetical protein
LELEAAVLGVVDAEGLGDVIGRGAGDGEAAVLYEAANLPVGRRQVRPVGAAVTRQRAFPHRRRLGLGRRGRGGSLRNVLFNYTTVFLEREDTTAFICVLEINWTKQRVLAQGQ